MEKEKTHPTSLRHGKSHEPALALLLPARLAAREHLERLHRGRGTEALVVRLLAVVVVAKELLVLLDGICFFQKQTYEYEYRNT